MVGCGAANPTFYWRVACPRHSLISVGADCHQQTSVGNDDDEGGDDVEGKSDSHRGFLERFLTRISCVNFPADGRRLCVLVTAAASTEPGIVRDFCVEIGAVCRKFVDLGRYSAISNRLLPFATHIRRCGVFFHWI